MSNTSRIINKFERFMETIRINNQKGVKVDNSKKDSGIIGYFTYDFKNLETYYTSLVNN